MPSSTRNLIAFLALVAFVAGLFMVGAYLTCSGTLGEDQCKADASGPAGVGLALLVAGGGTIVWALREDARERKARRAEVDAPKE